MTLTELKNEVATLGAEVDIPIDTALISAANRALLTIFTERPLAKCVRIPTSRPSVSYHAAKISHAGGECKTILLEGKSYAFRVSGKGSFTPPGSRVPISFDSEDALFRGFINGGGEIKFEGEYFYTVYNLTAYADTVSESVADIPEYLPYREYNIGALFGDFLFFLEPPTQNGEPLSDTLISGETVRIFGEVSGEILVTYARAPRKISPDSPSANIDISGECQRLLPLLTAAYMWLDDDAEKAQYYMSLYQNGMGFIRRYNTGTASAKYRDVTGWA